jgi:peptidoglycan/LPS O-acetylase OafA/YrhL
MTAPHLSYRPEIDGLRAVAVLPVVLYHFGVPGFPGGFVGVDVFFVISGFLIGGLLWAELESTGRIRLGAFFGRRIRRLATAYLAMALATLVAAWFILLPFDFREFGQELVAATVYLANVHFFRDAGYFATASDQKLLLHTWSLAVEEQFYVVLPLLMLALARWRRTLPALLVGLGLLSLVACIAMMRLSPTAAFYLFPFRAWELLAGVVMAILAQRSGFGWQVHGALSWAGLGLIALAVFGFSAGDHFPGAYALAPVAGAVLIILNGRHANPVNRMLASRPFLFFGLISYSLYLWHWPMVVLLKYYLGADHLGPSQIAGLMVAAVAVSWLSWRFIETPVRRGLLPGWRLPVVYAGAAAALVGAALSFAFSDGWPNRFSPEARPFIAATRGFHQDWSRCRVPRDGPWAGIEICPIGPEGPPRVLVWGDSHARAFKEGVEKAAFDAGTPGLLIWRGGCPPLLGVWKDEKVSTPAEEALCAASGPAVLKGLEGTPGIDTVLLIGRWAYYAEGTGVGVDAGNWIRISERPGEVPAPDAQRALVARAMADTAARLGQDGRRVFALRQIPEAFGYTARRAARDVAYGRSTAEALLAGDATTDRAAIEARNAAADAGLRAAFPPERIVDLWDRVCTASSCGILLDGAPAYYDNNHVTNSGAIGMRDGFRPVFEGG